MLKFLVLRKNDKSLKAIVHTIYGVKLLERKNAINIINIQTLERINNY